MTPESQGNSPFDVTRTVLHGRSEQAAHRWGTSGAFLMLTAAAMGSGLIRELFIAITAGGVTWPLVFTLIGICSVITTICAAIYAIWWRPRKTYFLLSIPAGIGVGSLMAVVLLLPTSRSGFAARYTACTCVIFLVLVVLIARNRMYAERKRVLEDANLNAFEN